VSTVSSRLCVAGTTSTNRNNPHVQVGGVYWYDVGGQWVGPTQKRLLAMAEEYGVKLYEATQCEYCCICECCVRGR
jgi:hypothetical protein